MRAASLFLFPALGVILGLLSTPAGGDHPPAREKARAQGPKVVLVIHGGVGVLSPEEMAREGLARGHYEEALSEALSAGYRALREEGKTSVDAVEAAIRVMEDSALFNAGRGAAFSQDGRVELDAALMEGKTQGTKDSREGKKDPRKRAGAVAGVTHVKNPISAARAVMEMEGQRAVMLVGEGAEWFALDDTIRRRYHIEKVSNVYFWTDRRLKDIRKEIEGQSKTREGDKRGGRLRGPDERGGGRADRRTGTVGAVALKGGKLAAGTSTGGLTGKLRGRVGDSPVIGAGTYADDRACGVSCTGTGEVFIRHAVAHDVVARMLYTEGLPVSRAARDAIDQLPDEEGGVGGLIALDRGGRHAFALSARSLGMYRGYVTPEGNRYVAIYVGDEPRLVRGPGKGTGGRR